MREELFVEHFDESFYCIVNMCKKQTIEFERASSLEI
jgi:hypothetical protein